MDIITRSRYKWEEGSWKRTQYFAYCFQDQSRKVLAQAGKYSIKVWTWSQYHTPSSPCHFKEWPQVIAATYKHFDNLDHTNVLIDERRKY